MVHVLYNFLFSLSPTRYTGFNTPSSSDGSEDSVEDTSVRCKSASFFPRLSIIVLSDDCADTSTLPLYAAEDSIHAVDITSIYTHYKLKGSKIEIWLDGHTWHDTNDNSGQTTIVDKEVWLFKGGIRMYHFMLE